MSEGTPEKPVPQSIEPRKFAQLGVSLKGSLPVDKLHRLQDAVLSIDSAMAELEFSVNDHREKTMNGTVSVTLQRQCQRCLEPVELKLDCTVALAAIWSETEAPDLSEAVEPWIVETETADLYSVLEDEVILALPIVSYHDNDCVSSELYQSGPVVKEGEGEVKQNPFQILEQLKKPKN